MSGNRFLLDTNIILYILGGDKIIANYLFNKILYSSVICEIEVLGFKSIPEDEENKIKNFLNEFRIISIDDTVKELTIQLRRKYALKIPDLIIAASSISPDVPLVTSDKAFKVINELQLDFYNK